MLLHDLQEAKTFWQRLKGLLGKTGLASGEGMLFQRCNAIHTIGMKFPIDCVFTDRKMKVQKIVAEVKPGRLVLPVWQASAVFELPAGFAEKMEIKKGDEFYVVH